MSTQTLLCGQSSLCDPLFELPSVCVTPLQKTANATFCYYYYSIKTLNAFFFFLVIINLLVLQQIGK